MKRCSLASASKWRWLLVVVLLISLPTYSAIRSPPPVRVVLAGHRRDHLGATNATHPSMVFSRTGSCSAATWPYSALAGALSCTISHSLMTPLDIIKTKLQTNSIRKDLSIVGQLMAIVRRDGVAALFTGVSATASGYLLQGACKFGFYDYFEDKLVAILRGRELDVQKYNVPILIVCSGAAEAIACVSLCPLEALKIYMMTHPNVAAKGFVASLKSIVLREGGPGALFRGLPWVMSRQVPYTCVKLAGYDLLSSYIRQRRVLPNSVGAADGTHAEAGRSINLRDRLTIAASCTSVPLISGVVAGLCAAAISQPADVLLSKMCGYSASSDSCLTVASPSDLWAAVRSLGLEGCFCGLRERSLMVASLTALQFSLYENIRASLPVPLSAGRVGKSCATATGRVTMHFEEALLGNSLLTQESLTRERYIATNRFKVRSNAGAKFEKRWADRKSRLADLAGFRFFTLLKRVDAFDSDYKDDGEAGNYISFTIWENKDNFDAWRTGDAFKEAHGGGSIMGFVELISTALFIIEGSPKPAFYDALLATVGQKLEFENLGGWRRVKADGQTELDPEVFLSQRRFEVPVENSVPFEQAWRSALSTANEQLVKTPGFVGFFVQRRDATKADDGYNYMVSTLWTDRLAYSSWKATSAVSDTLVADRSLFVRSKPAYYEGKLALSSKAGI